MSILTCSGYLTRDNSPPLMTTVRAIEGLIAARQEGDVESTRSFVFYTSATSLPLRLSPSGYGFPLPYLVVFCLAFCLAVILALAICFTVSHTRRRRRRETVLMRG